MTDIRLINALVLADRADNPLAEALQRRVIPTTVQPEMRRLPDGAGLRHQISFLRCQAPHLLHIHNSYFRASPYLPVVARLAGVRHIVVTKQSNHPIQPSPLGIARKWLVGQAIDVTLAVSNAVRDTLINKYHYPPARVRVIRNAVDVNTIASRIATMDAGATRALFDCSPRDVVIGAVANLRSEKGIIYLVEAMPIILREFPDARLIVAGEGPQRAEIEAIVQKHQLTERVVLMGWRADIVPVLAAMDVFVLPSVIEGFPLTVLEAMAAGRPIVATAVGGTPEAITDHQTGILVPPADVPALAQAIIELLAHGDLARTLGQNARSIALTRHGIETMVQNYLELYRELGVG